MQFLFELVVADLFQYVGEARLVDFERLVAIRADDVLHGWYPRKSGEQCDEYRGLGGSWEYVTPQIRLS